MLNLNATRGRNAARITAPALALIALAPLFGGCSLIINPYVDTLENAGDVDTPSAALARERGGEPTRLQRFDTTINGPGPQGTVQHAALYFEDEFEDKGSEDGRFAWTLEDHLFQIAWPCRFGLNLAALPVSAIVTPPWTIMESDGHLSRQIPGYCHDAAPAVSP